jgi:Fe(3+) dicitrate transport protein
MSASRTVLALTLPLLCAPAVAPAQEVPPPPPDTAAVRLTAIEVRAVLSEEIVHTPGAAAVLSRAELERLRPRTLHDAFDFVPGVRTIDDDALGLRAGIGIRGAPPRRSRKTLLLEDGTPINGSAYLDPGAHYTPPMERLERIEVLRGAGQIVHGPLNNHGVVNFRNARPTAAPRTTVELSAGEGGTFRRHAMHARTEGPVGVVAAYTGMDADGVFDVERHRFDDLFGAVEWHPAPDHRLSASATRFGERSRGYDESNLTPEQFALDPRGKSGLGEGREFNNISVEHRRGQVAYDARLAGGLGLSARAFATRLDRPRFQTRGRAPADGGVMEGRDRLYRTAGAEVRVELAGLRTPGLAHTLQGGVRHERHRFDDARPVGRPGEALDRGSRGEVYALAGVDGYTRTGRLVTYRAPAVSAFVQDAIRAGAWVVTPGVRAERYRQARRIDFWPGNADEGTEAAERHTLLLPGVSVLYDGLGAAQVYAGVHRGFAPATARTEDFPLVPETGVTSQVGVRAAAGRGVGVELAGFHGRIENTLVRSEVDVFGDAVFVNAADSRVHGIEAGWRIDSAPYTGARVNLFAQGAYDLTHAVFAGGALDGRRVPEIPRHAGSATVGVEVGESWLASATLSHFGDFFADMENTRELRADGGRVPARTLLSARAVYTVHAAPHAAVWVQGRNLADRLYVSDVQDGLRPGAPRAILGGVSLRF